MIRRRPFFLTCCVLAILVGPLYATIPIAEQLSRAVKRTGTTNDICVVLGLPSGIDAESLLTTLCGNNDMQVYVQTPSSEEADAIRMAAEEAEWLGSKVFVEEGPWESIHLATHLAGMVFVSDSAAQHVKEEELLRVVYSGGTVFFGNREIVTPPVEDTDSWSHPYHGPDNNPQSLDRRARAPYMTQFLADPKFVPMPEISVAAGGKIFRAFGHIAHKANQNAMLNTLICVTAYNGRIVWKRPLKEGFMIHRNTMIATDDILYMADDVSCKLIDTKTGAVREEIVIPEGVGDGPVWKWMGMENGILYALVGGPEVAIETKQSRTPGLGHWPWGMWAGHDYKDPKTNFGFGRTFAAIDPNTKKIFWTFDTDEYIDSRGVCMKNGKIYYYVPDKLLACLDTDTHDIAWKTSAPDVLNAIGPNGPAQHYVTGYATTTYIKCNDDYIFFAGPQRSRLAVINANNGKLAWDKEGGNLQLVLRDDGFYAAGPQQTGAKYTYATGEVLAHLPHRRACTRATGSVDSIFFRTPGGTVRIATDSDHAQHIAPMRPPCQDGVIISDGQLFWGPWMCGCQLSLYGHIALSPAGDFDFHPPLNKTRLEIGPAYDKADKLPKLEASIPGNAPFPSFVRFEVPKDVKTQWNLKATSAMPTAPVTAGDLTFIADRQGVIRALNRDGQLKWKTYTGGAIYYRPAVSKGRLYVGSADGYVYALSAGSGERLWRFRVGPAGRYIPAYGKLISTWPVAGGVVVRDDIVYAAAGITHYDGTYVVALDAETGHVKWYNDTSGLLSEDAGSGISLQGPLWIFNNELRFAGGGVYREAQYDLATGKCLNEPYHGVNSSYATAFYAYFPDYAQYQWLGHGYHGGKLLNYNVSYEGSQHGHLALLGPAQTVNDKPQRPTLWQDKTGTRYHAFVVTPEILLAAGDQPLNGSTRFTLSAIKIADGTVLWQKELPAPAVKGGLTLDDQQRILVTLTDGRVMCFTDSRSDVL